MKSALLCAVALAGCYDLPDIPRGVCGNGVVEAGEDCDLFANPDDGAGLTCNERCRYACVAALDPACPRGWGCGFDGTCRHGDGTFSVGKSIDLPTHELGSGALDGNGRVQAIGSDTGSLRVLRYGVTLTTTPLRVVASSVFATHSLSPGAPAALLTTGGIDEFGWTTDTSGTFRALLAGDPVIDADPTTPAIDPIEDGVRILPLRVDSDRDHQYPFYIVQAEHGLMINALTSGTLTTVLPSITGSLAKLVPHPAIGNIDADAGDEIAIAFEGGTTAWVISTTCTGTCTQVRSSSFVITKTVALPQPAGDRLVFGDIDSDGGHDLIVATANGDGAMVLRDVDSAATTGTASSPTNFFMSSMTNALLIAFCGGDQSLFPPGILNPPLLSDDLDGDGRIDYVTKDSIARHPAALRYCRAAAVVNATDAIVVDINGDGRKDVALIDGGVASVQLQSATHDFDYQEIVIPDNATAESLEVTDVDGDGLSDVIIHAVGIDHTSRELWVAHGTPDPRRIEVTRGPSLEGATTAVAGAYPRFAGSSGAIALFGRDAATGLDFKASVGVAGGELGSVFGFDLSHGSLIAYDLQLGRFLAGGLPDTFDALVMRGQNQPSTTFEVWPSQGALLRHWNGATTTLGSNDAGQVATSVRVVGDVDGDGLDELCVITGGSGTVLQCYGFTADAPGPTLALRPMQVKARAPIMLSASRYSAPVAAQLVDLDGDGSLELVAAFTTEGVVAWSDLTTEPNEHVIRSTPARAMLATNVDADPALEVVVLDDALHVYDGDTELGVVAGVTGATGPITATDLDGDGVNEVVVAATDESALVCWPSTNTGHGPQ